MKNFLVKTKGNSLHKYSEGKKGRYIAWIVVAFLVLVLAKNVIQTASATLINSLYFVRHYVETSSATIPVFIRSRIELLDTIRELEQQLLSRQGSNESLARVLEENNELRELLSASSSKKILAGVIARPPYTPYDTIVLDRGSDDGVAVHAPVYYGAGMALGYVRAVTAHSALVTLFSSPGVETTVYVYGAQVFTTAYGEGGGIVRISVPQGIPLEVGKPVILPSIDTGVLGTIHEIQSIPSEPEQHAYVTFTTPLQSIRIVGVGVEPIREVSFDDALNQVNEFEKSMLTIEVPDEFKLQVDEHDTATTSSAHDVSTTTTP